jgi:Transposase
VPDPEVARLGRTLKAWRPQLLAYLDTSGVSNGGTEAINLIIEKVRRLAHGFRDFTHYRLRILLAASATALTANDPAHAELRRPPFSVWRASLIRVDALVCQSSPVLSNDRTRLAPRAM